MWRGRLLVPWLLGFFLIANVYLFPFLKQTPRVTDALSIVLALWLLWRFVTTGLRTEPVIALLVFSAIPLLWGIYASTTGDTSTVVLSVRWLLSVPWGYALFTAAREPQWRTSLIWGLWCGCVASATVLPFQFYGFLNLTQKFGLAAQDTALTWVNVMLFRAPGVEGHPNGSAAIISLAVPLGLYLYGAQRARIWIVIVSLGVLLAAAQFTETRSIVLVSAVTILVTLTRYKSSAHLLSATALLMYVGLPLLYWLGPPGGWDRWVSHRNIEHNMSERLLSNVGALQVALEHPLGLGIEAGRRVLQNETSISSTHNAFLQVAVVYGAILAATLALLILVLALQIFTSLKAAGALETMLALQMFGLFLFEAHFNSPTFVILTSWLVATGAVRIGATLRRRSPTRSRLAPMGRYSRIQFLSRGLRQAQGVVAQSSSKEV